MLKTENANLSQQLNNKNLDLKKMVHQNESLNEELEKLNEEYQKIGQHLDQAENNSKSLQIKLNEKIQDVKIIF